MSLNNFLPMAREREIHLLLRYGDAFLSVDDTIAEHKAVIASRGAVWFGKIGKTLGARHIKAINDQCNRGCATYVFFAKRVSGEYRIYKGRVIEVVRRLPPSEKSLVPEYYWERGIDSYVRLWIKLSKLSTSQKSMLREWQIASSGRNVGATLGSSMAAMFLIERGRGSSI